MTHRFATRRTVKPKVLLVDDEPMLLEGLYLHLRPHYNVSRASSGAEALEILEREGTFAVVLSDMRMPGMTGAELLERVRQIAPGTVRLLLTGYTELSGLEAAVNQGGIFRFLTKPCMPDNLLAAVDAAAEQFRTLRAERTLLEETLAASIDVLTEVLALSNPVAFGRGRRVKRLIGQLASRLNLPDIWQYEVAAMLCQLGVLAAPSVGLPEHDASDHIHRGVTQRLLERIPRLEVVASMIGGSHARVSVADQLQALGDVNPEILGAVLLTLCLELDQRDMRSRPHENIAEMKMSGRYAQPIIDVIADISVGLSQSRIHELSLHTMEGAV
jgi:CheY-like chemotaxis protein